jgi:hypothetical protein
MLPHLALISTVVTIGPVNVYLRASSSGEPDGDHVARAARDVMRGAPSRVQVGTADRTTHPACHPVVAAEPFQESE